MLNKLKYQKFYFVFFWANEISLGKKLSYMGIWRPASTFLNKTLDF